jgi:hypothetical protein
MQAVHARQGRRAVKPDCSCEPSRDRVPRQSRPLLPSRYAVRTATPPAAAALRGHQADERSTRGTRPHLARCSPVARHPPFGRIEWLLARKAGWRGGHAGSWPRGPARSMHKARSPHPWVRAPGRRRLSAQARLRPRLPWERPISLRLMPSLTTRLSSSRACARKCEARRSGGCGAPSRSSHRSMGCRTTRVTLPTEPLSRRDRSRRLTESAGGSPGTLQARRTGGTRCSPSNQAARHPRPTRTLRAGSSIRDPRTHPSPLAACAKKVRGYLERCCPYLRAAVPRSCCSSRCTEGPAQRSLELTLAAW